MIGSLSSSVMAGQHCCDSPGPPLPQIIRQQSSKEQWPNCLEELGSLINNDEEIGKGGKNKTKLRLMTYGGCCDKRFDGEYCPWESAGLDGVYTVISLKCLHYSVCPENLFWTYYIWKTFADKAEKATFRNRIFISVAQTYCVFNYSRGEKEKNKSQQPTEVWSNHMLFAVWFFCTIVKTKKEWNPLGSLYTTPQTQVS